MRGALACNGNARNIDFCKHLTVNWVFHHINPYMEFMAEELKNGRALQTECSGVRMNQILLRSALLTEIEQFQGNSRSLRDTLRSRAVATASNPGAVLLGGQRFVGD
jgi:hypothetical protein